MSCDLGAQGFFGYVGCCYETLPKHLSPVVSLPVYIVIVSVIVVLLRFVKGSKKRRDARFARLLYDEFLTSSIQFVTQR